MSMQLCNSNYKTTHTKKMSILTNLPSLLCLFHLPTFPTCYTISTHLPSHSMKPFQKFLLLNFPTHARLTSTHPPLFQLYQTVILNLMKYVPTYIRPIQQPPIQFNGRPLASPKSMNTTQRAYSPWPSHPLPHRISHD